MADAAHKSPRSKRSRVEVKAEPSEPPDEAASWATALGALGLCPVGASPPAPPRPQQTQALNARGMPARIRKRNKLFFDDDIVNAPPPRSAAKRGPKTPAKSPSRFASAPAASPSPASASKATPVKRTPVKPKPERTPVDRTRSGSPDRNAAQRIGTRLRNLLKLPKAHRWVCCEHFYSNIDKVLLAGENDFSICLRESFPKLTNRNLAQVQWTKIRRMMGKPRRCSQAFFDEERTDLEEKRNKIRYLQQRKGGQLYWRDLPNEIPMQLVIGTKVTARLRRPQDGIYTGIVDGVDTSDNTYRITFDRPGLGTHSVPDHEVLSNEPPDTMNLAVMTKKSRSKHTMYRGEEPSFGDMFKGEQAVGPYPLAFLEILVRVNNMLKDKTEKVNLLQEYNYDIERRKSFGEPTPVDLERKYAIVLIQLERINLNLKTFFKKCEDYCERIAPGITSASNVSPTHVSEKCHNEAIALVDKHCGESTLSDLSKEFITDLISLLLQVKNLSDSIQPGYELEILKNTINDIKSRVPSEMKMVFENCVDIHMKRIQSWLISPSPFD